MSCMPSNRRTERGTAGGKQIGVRICWMEGRAIMDDVSVTQLVAFGGLGFVSEVRIVLRRVSLPREKAAFSLDLASKLFSIGGCCLFSSYFF